MKRFLVGYDGSPQATEAARMAARLAGPTGATVTALSVEPPVSTLAAAVLPVRCDPEVEWMARAGAAVVRALGAEADGLTARGVPAEVLLDTAARDAYHLVLVGHRGHGRLKEAVLGSVAK